MDSQPKATQGMEKFEEIQEKCHGMPKKGMEGGRQAPTTRAATEFCA